MLVRLSHNAYADLDRLEDFLVQIQDPFADAFQPLLFSALRVLAHQPQIGRPVGDGLRELIISRGRSGYLARYRVSESQALVQVLRIRHQRDSGYTEDEI